MLLAQQLARADERGRTLELLRRQQTKRVAHEDGDALSAVACFCPITDDSLQAPDGDGIGREPQVGLCLAATGGKEQELRLAVKKWATPGIAMGWVGQPG